MGKITKKKKSKKSSPKQLQEEYMSFVASDLVNGWAEDIKTQTRDSRLLAYTKAVRQEATNNSTLLKLQATRLTDSVFDSLSAVNKSIASGKIEDARLKTRIDVNQDALERADTEIRKVTQALYNTGLKTAKNSESVMALTSRVRSLSQDLVTTQNYLIISGLISIIAILVSLTK